MKIVNITLHAINNYGSVFQALATERLFEEFGCDVETIDYIRETAQEHTIGEIIRQKNSSWKQKIRVILSRLLTRQNTRSEKLDEFRKNYLHLTKQKYRSDLDLENNPPEADIYCTGSDQTWNTVCQGGVPRAFFLHFVPEEKKKISFSASFGVDALPEKDKAEVKELLQRYDSISVREIAGIDILHDMGIEGTLVADPTLAVEAEFWSEFAAPRMFQEDYLLAYQLNRNSRFTKYMKVYAKAKGVKLVHLRTHKDAWIRNGVCLTSPTPQEWLSLFKYAKYVLTDSFHGTVFSLIFHKDFMNILPQNYSSRLESILNITGLDNRIIKDYNDYTYCDHPIDYTPIDPILEKYRQETRNFLNKALLDKQITE